MKKNVLLTFALILMFSVSSSAQNRIHIVQRGETLETIARKYSIPIEKLIEINPKAEQVFYSGLSLNIPESSVSGELQEPVSKQKYSNPLPEESPERDISTSTSSLNRKPTYGTPEGKQRVANINANSFFYIIGHGYFKNDAMRYGGQISFGGIILVEHFGVDFSGGWNLQWNPSFDAASCVFGLGPVYMTKLTDDIRLYIPAKLMTSVVGGEIPEGFSRFSWFGRVNPMLRFGRYFTAGVYADFNKDITLWGLSVGISFPEKTH